jgi:EmrB/QacA subfamily drug resistance transporter
MATLAGQLRDLAEHQPLSARTVACREQLVSGGRTCDCLVRGGLMASQSDPLGPEVTRAGVVVVLGTIMAIFDTTIVAVALPALGRAFHEGVSTIQWVTTAYLLAIAVVIPVSGYAIHRVGAKQTFIASLTMFIIGSALCGLSWSASSLIAFRVLQGLGGGMIMPVGQAIMARLAGPARMGKVMGYIGIPTMLGPILGPVVGGLIISNISWRWIFFVNVPVGIVTLLLTRNFLPATPRDSAHRFDLIGFLALSPGLALITYGLSEVGSKGAWSGPTVVWPLVSGVLLIVAFGWRSLHSPEPLLELRLFSDRTFAASCAAIFFVGAILYGTMFLLPLYYQIALGKPAWEAGLLMAPQGIGAALVTRPAGAFADRHGTRWVALVGVILMALGTSVFTTVSNHSNLALLGGALAVRGIGLGLLMMPTIAASYRTLSRQQVPKATSATNIVRQVGGSLGVAIFAVALVGQLRATFGPHGGSLSSGLGTLPPSIAADLATAFGHTFWWPVGVCLVTAIPVLAIPQRVAPTPPELAPEVLEETVVALAD